MGSVRNIRSSRLTAIILLLEARGLMTARELSQYFEVSVRTILRDIDALSAAGVPVYGERGTRGGYRLMEGYRMRPPALTSTEAGALWLAGLPDAAARLGLGSELASAQLKLLAVMGPDQRAEAARVRELVYVDQPGWFGAEDEPEHLAAVTEAVWAGSVIRVRYQSWTAESVRTLEPLGMVLKGGTWYLVAQERGQATPRTYRLSRIHAVEPVGEAVPRPQHFDLKAYWQQASLAFVQRVYSMEASIRVSPDAVPDLYHLGSAVYVAGMREVASDDAAGWRRFLLPFENVREAARDIIRLGGDAEVLAPEELRAEVLRVARDILGCEPESSP
jgi:predicted DNA-binding transcriptional regulator YafY